MMEPLKSLEGYILTQDSIKTNELLNQYYKDMIWDNMTPEEQERTRQYIRKCGEYINEQKCLHEHCLECHGTGKKEDETQCIHYISCPCSKCTLNL